MLKNRQNFHNKKGLGFNKRRNNKKRSKESYRTTSKMHFGFINYYYYNQRGHHIRDYSYKNGTFVLRTNEKLLWLLKSTPSKSYPSLSTNFVGPKPLRYYQ